MIDNWPCLRTIVQSLFWATVQEKGGRMSHSDTFLLTIGQFRVEPSLGEISREGARVRLEPRAMQLLLSRLRDRDEPNDSDARRDRASVDHEAIGD